MARGLWRVATALTTAAVCTCTILRTTGLLPGLRPVGVADNSDGARLFGAAGLVPDTADQQSDWKPGVVLHFRRAEPADDAIPSAALPILRAAAHGFPEQWSLTRLGRTYAVLTGALAGVAAWAASADHLAGGIALLPVLIPLANRDFVRFFVSTYSEPAGLVAAVTLLSGTVVLAVSRAGRHVERVHGLAMASGGGLLAITAKVGYAPLLPIGAAVCVTTGQHAGRVAAVVALLASVRPVRTALRWQSRFYPGVNAHNLAFTMVLPEFGPRAATVIGLPPAAAAHAGRGSSDDRGTRTNFDQIPGWRATIGTDPRRVQLAAYRYLVRHPSRLARVVGVAMQATRGREIDYLRDDPLPAGSDAQRVVPVTGSTGYDRDALRAWLDGMPAPWWPSLLAAVGVVVGSVACGHRNDLVRAMSRVAGVSAVGAVGIALCAVLGDGYYEIAKHVWLSGYLLDVTGLSLLGTVVVVLNR